MLQSCTEETKDWTKYPKSSVRETTITLIQHNNHEQYYLKTCFAFSLKMFAKITKATKIPTDYEIV